MVESSNPNQKYIIGGLLAVAVVAGGILLWPKTEPPAPIIDPAPTTATPPEPENYPVPSADTASGSLPELAASDDMMVNSANTLIGAGAVERWLIPSNIVRNIVVTVDNLPRKKFAERQKPVKAVPGRFEVEGPEGDLSLAASNAARYSLFIDAVQQLNMNTVAKEYFRLYPLFQEAYKDLGYPDGYFNNRLVKAIDDMLAAPTIASPIKLTRPNVLYEFADPKLENLSAGQKIMIRMGADNQAKFKAKLRELRAAVVAGK
jgi:hypothetical protein